MRASRRAFCRMHLCPRRLALAGLATVCLVVCSGMAACGPAGSVPHTVKLGLVAPVEGVYRDLGYEVLHAVRLAVRERNAAGGVGGCCLVELVALNDLNEADEAGRQAAEIAVDPDVLAVLAGWSPETYRQSEPVFGQLGLAFAGPAPDWPGLGAEAARVAWQDLSARRVAVLYQPSESAGALADAFIAAFESHGGEIVARSTPVPDAASPVPPTQLDAVDTLFVAAEPLVAAEWIVAARRLGFAGRVIGGPEMGHRLLVQVAGQASEGTVYVSSFAPLPADPAFAERYRQLSGGAAPGPVAAWAYAQAHRLLDAIDLGLAQTELPARAAVRRALAEEVPHQREVFVYAVQDGDLFAGFELGSGGAER